MAHRSTKVTNVAASVDTRLKSLSKRTGQPFSDLLLLYTLQGFLRRLEQSAYKDHLVLKGGLLLFGMQAELGRATRDLDLLGRHTPIDLDSVAALVREICLQAPPEDDGLRFDAENVKTEIITEENEYPGVRARFYGYLAHARSRVVVDVAAGDPIIPGPRAFPYPILLGQQPLILQAYSIESIVAEKLDALANRGLLTSRLKDCYDLWMLAGQHPFDGSLLQQAIQATFAARGRVFTPELPIILTPAFAEDTQKQQQWAAFLNAKSATSAPASLAEALAPVTQLLKPLWQASSTGETFSGCWDCAAAEWRAAPDEPPTDDEASLPDDAADQPTQ
ncbi:MAG TPA: nucleotidyl transferase AbiEii/AbiGii toxin family protein [Ktedonobacterales bacterium]|nr:nucleotidyl transferase AbiEii/AbiGii toxin family protein [Ktedonobacterales bacterium]